MLTRRITSTVDVRRDQSLIISGMFFGEDSNVRAGVPFLKDIPILGLPVLERPLAEIGVGTTGYCDTFYRQPAQPAAAGCDPFRPDTTTPALDAIRRAHAGHHLNADPDGGVAV